MFHLNNSFGNIGAKVQKKWTLLKHNPYFVPFIIFATLIFSKLFYFHFSIEHPTWPQSISLFFLPKIAISLLMSSFILITKKHWWTIYASLLIDIWIIGNIIYYRASGFFINTEALQMADNMQGFWDSILIYFSWEIFIPLFLTLLYTVIITKLPLKQLTRHKCLFFIIILLSFSMRMFINYFHHSDFINDYWIRKEKINFTSIWNTIRPIIDSQYDAYNAARLHFTHGISTNWEKQYIMRNTILDFLLADISYYVNKKYFESKIDDLKQLTSIDNSDEIIINRLINKNSSSITATVHYPQTNLIVILFESLEGWIFENFDGSEHIAPNMKKLIEMKHTMFAPRVKSQVRQGNSGDGQMIVLTGLLPLKAGAACRLYGKNSYPNYAHFFNSSMTINPSPGAWNQQEINPNYGIKQLIEFSGNDEELVDSIISKGDYSKEPFFLVGITVASHSPFNCNKIYKSILPNDMPVILQNYLNCVNYTDKNIGKLISKIENNPHWRNTTLVIVGDHTVFKEHMLDKFHKYAQKANISLKAKQNYIPLIIYSPQITAKTIEHNICYQSDIYPTILNLIGIEDYYWKGVGKDIFSTDKSTRLDEETGYRISDIIIRNNYFKEYDKSNKHTFE